MRVHLVIPMPSFILTAIDDDGTNTTKEFTNDELKDVVDKTSDFLKGSGMFLMTYYIQFRLKKTIMCQNLLNMLNK